MEPSDAGDGASAEDIAAALDAHDTGPSPTDTVAREDSSDAGADAAVGDTAVLDAGAIDAAPDAMIPAPGRPIETLVQSASVWRYLDDGMVPGSRWMERMVDDSAWREGGAPLGYGNGDERTVVRAGPDPMRRAITTYFRREFLVRDAGAIRQVQLRLRRDDGAVVFLNGSEVFRSNMPAGMISSGTLASSTVGGDDESLFVFASLAAGGFVEGRNVLAVELHQAAATSSDLSFDLELSVRRAVVDTSGDPTALAVGDIAVCGSRFDEATSLVADGIAGPALLLGDTVYNNGTTAEFRDCFNPSWGRHRARARPAVGNHEYGSPGAGPYFDYFGASAGDRMRGYYSYEIGSWHAVVLNSNCSEVGGCGAGSPQERWLREDLRMHPTRCTLAYWHHPRFSSGQHGSSTSYGAFWTALQEANADVILVGHEHDYERFAPLNAMGEVDPMRGIRQLIVGTGGAGLRTFSTLVRGGVARDITSHGVLKMTLREGLMEYEFVPVAGDRFVDLGHLECH